MNKNALTLKLAESFIYADAASGMTLGMDIINNICLGRPLPADAVTMINRCIRREGPMGSAMYPIRDIYGEKEIDSSGHPAKTVGADVQSERTASSSMDLYDRIFGKRRTGPHTDDRRAADAVEGHDEDDVDTDALDDEVDRLLFGEGTYTERQPGSQSPEEIENSLLKQTLLTQVLVGLHTLQALYDDTDFDDLVEDMVENLREKRDSLIRG